MSLCSSPISPFLQWPSASSGLELPPLSGRCPFPQGRPSFKPSLGKGCKSLSGRSQPAGCTRLQGPSCLPALGATGPLIGRGCCFHGDSQQSPRPPLLPPRRPYSVAGAATGRLIKQEPREELGCGPSAQHGGRPEERGRMGVRRQALACCPGSALRAPANGGPLPRAGWGVALALGGWGLSPWVHPPAVALEGSVPSPSGPRDPVTGRGGVLGLGMGG